jgi:hypothetical protein
MGRIVSTLPGWLGRRLGRYLNQPSHACSTAAPTDPIRLMACVRPGDVLLVEGNTRVSVAIKYLTQSTWSHAALFVGNATEQRDEAGQPCCFVEADIVHGVRAIGVSSFKGLHCRVCRPVGLSATEIDQVIRFVVDRLGHQYDLQNVVDLARYLFPTPPVPVRWRRRMLAMGSGDPTRAICSTLIAQAFQSVRYPILPIIDTVPKNDPACPGCVAEILRIRHHSLFVPRDFDVSPYFEIVKPTLLAGFDHRALEWEDRRVTTIGRAVSSAEGLNAPRAPA